MKAEYRHELKTNELAAWLMNFPQWVKDNLKMIIYFAVVIVLAAGAYFWNNYQKNIVQKNEKLRFTALVVELARNKQQCIAGQAQNADYSYTLIQTSNKLQEFANSTKNKDMAALALVKGAEALRTELHYHPGLMDKQYWIDQTAKAKSFYEQGFAKSQDISIKAQSLLGQGLCEEELGNYENAAQIYTKIKDDASFAGTAASAAAAQRLILMDEFKDAIVFVSAPRPAVVPVSAEQAVPNVDPEIIKALAPAASSNVPDNE